MTSRSLVLFLALCVIYTPVRATEPSAQTMTLLKRSFPKAPLAVLKDLATQFQEGGDAKAGRTVALLFTNSNFGLNRKQLDREREDWQKSRKHEIGKDGKDQNTDHLSVLNGLIFAAKITDGHEAKSPSEGVFRKSFLAAYEAELQQNVGAQATLENRRKQPDAGSIGGQRKADGRYRELLTRLTRLKEKIKDGPVARDEMQTEITATLDELRNLGTLLSSFHCLSGSALKDSEKEPSSH